MVHDLCEGGCHVFHHVLVHEAWHDGHRDDGAAVLDYGSHVLVLQTDNVLAVHLTGASDAINITALGA